MKKKAVVWISIIVVIVIIVCNLIYFNTKENNLVHVDTGNGAYSTYFSDAKAFYKVPDNMKFNGWYVDDKKVGLFTRLKESDYVYPRLEYKNDKELQSLGFEFEIIDDDTAAITNSPKDIFTVPSRAYINNKYYKINTIKSEAICGKTSSLYIPDSIEVIEDNSIHGVNNIYGAKNLKSLGYNNRKLNYFKLNSNLESAYIEDIIYCKLDIGQKLELKSKGIIDLSNHKTFDTYLNVDKNNPYLYFDGTSLYNKDKTFLYLCLNRDANTSLTYNLEGFSSIAFTDVICNDLTVNFSKEISLPINSFCYITSNFVTINADIAEISSAFERCNINNLTLNGTIKKIDSAFSFSEYENIKLKSVDEIIFSFNEAPYTCLEFEHITKIEDSFNRYSLCEVRISKELDNVECINSFKYTTISLF
mgnify:CR=1 FL=1